MAEEIRKPLPKRAPVEQPRIDPRTPTNKVPGGRCSNCTEVFIGKELYRHKGTSFVCKDCLVRLKEEERTRRDEEEEFDSHLEVIDDDDL